jgi:tetratricopeptide (TPR) repeat protein
LALASRAGILDHSMTTTPNAIRALLLTAAVWMGAGAFPQGVCADEVVSELLEKATEQVTFFDWDKARSLYQAAMDRAESQSDPWQSAVFGLAVALQQATPANAGAIARAGDLYQKLADEKLGSRFAARSLMNLGRMAEVRDFYGDQPDLPAARGYYAQVIARFPHDEIASEATLRLAGSYVQTFKPEDLKKGADILENWLAAHPADPFASGMWQYTGDAHFYLGGDRAALDAYVKADALGWMDPGNEGPILWRMAVLADRRLNDPATAGRYYTRIITDVPYSGKAYESQLALKRLGLPVPTIQLVRAATQSATAPAATQPAADDVKGQQ